MGKNDPEKVVESYAVWGGIPRYWELAMEFPSVEAAIRELILNPLGVLYREPERLLSDQMRDTRQAASLLSIIGQGCHRLSEIATRLEKPATALSRPLAILVDLGLIKREIPFGAAFRDSKRTLYQIADPFLRTWITFVEPNRSLLEAGLSEMVFEKIQPQLPRHIGYAWEELARESVPRVEIQGKRFGLAGRFWGKLNKGENCEFDIVAASIDDECEILIGEAKTTCSPKDVSRSLFDLKHKASRCSAFAGKNITCALWVLKGVTAAPEVVTASQVIAALK
jgi:hypothetical protein